MQFITRILEQNQEGTDVSLLLSVGIADANVTFEVTLHGVQVVRHTSSGIGIVTKDGIPLIMNFSLPS